jgi:hypothetical protein
MLLLEGPAMGRPVRGPVSGAPTVPGPPAPRAVAAVREPERGQLHGGLRPAGVAKANRRRLSSAARNPARTVLQVGDHALNCFSVKCL